MFKRTAVVNSRRRIASYVIVSSSYKVGAIGYDSKAPLREIDEMIGSVDFRLKV